MTRIFHSSACMRPNPDQVERTLITGSPQTNVIGWHLLPGQQIDVHAHPHGQDTWVVLEGEAEYLLGGGATRLIRSGDIAVAGPGEPHGARNTGVGPFVFISVVAPADAGFELVEG